MYAFASNIYSMLAMAVAILILPKILTMEQYGYFQLYLFYINYIGFLHFGLADGVYLRFAGIYYNKLNLKKISGQFWLLTIAEIVIVVIFFVVNHNFGIENEQVILYYVGTAVLIFLPRTFLQYILQGTNRIKEYANLQIIERTVFCILILIGVLKIEKKATFYMIADLSGKLVALVFAGYYCKDIITSKLESISDIIKEGLYNIRIGIKIMFSNIASMLIIGIAQIAVEWKWNVETFGEISLTIYISNLLMILIRAIAIVIFPELKRKACNELPSIYKAIRNKWILLIAALLIVYYPAQFIVSLWLPQYKEGIRYMAILFPLCIFESKISMLTETYLKVYRKEKEILRINIIALICSILLTFISVAYFENLTFTIFTILIVTIIRSILAEIYLMKIMKINTKTDMLEELFLTSTFILGSFLIKGTGGLLLYCIVYTVFFFRKDGIKELKELIRFKSE